MGGNFGFGVILENLNGPGPLYAVAGWLQNPFKLCDFPLVTLITLLY